MAEAVLAVPYIDEGMPILQDDDGVPKDATRWLWFPGDVLSPRRTRELRNMVGLGVYVDSKLREYGVLDRETGKSLFKLYANGGEELNSPCLLRTKSVLPRAMFTPLEIAAVWTPPDLIPEGTPTFRGIPTPGGKWHETLPGIKTFPGEALPAILTATRNDQGNNKGVAEISDLRAVTWEQFVKDGLQSVFFPEWPVLPRTLRELVALIAKHERSSLGGIASEMLEACDHFRLWGMERIKFEENLVSVGTTKDGWTYRYSDVADRLFDQLEVVRQDQEILSAAQMQRQLNESIDKLVSVQGQNHDVAIVDAIAKLQENQARLNEMILQALDKVTSPEPKTPKATK